MKVGIASTLGIYTNTAYVTGTPQLPPQVPPDLPGFPPLPPLPPVPVTDTNPSHYETLGLNLGNYVWYDVNNNGIVDSGETGVNGVRVDLYRDSDGDGAYTPGTDAFVTNATTTNGGYYSFTNLSPGGYVVVIPANNFTGAGALSLDQARRKV